MAVKRVRLTREVEYAFGKIYQGTVFEVINIGGDKRATVMIAGKATFVIPSDSYEVVDDDA